MLTKERCYEIAEQVKRISSADEIEVYISGGRSALTRFANNTIHQNVADENHAVSVRTVFSGRTARATSNKLDEDSLRRVVQTAENLSKVQHPNPDLLPMTDGKEPLRAVPSRWFEETRAVGPQQRAEGVGKIVEVAKREKLVTAGIFAVSEYMEALFNSRGMARHHQQTSSEISITMLADDSSGWQKSNSPDVRNLNAAALAETAARKARQSVAPRELAPGKYTVILEPAAVLDLVGFMFYDFAGLAVLDQRSFLNNRVSTKLFGENITIYDDVSHPLQSGSPFDGEGVARQSVTLVEKGIAKNLVYARATAEKMKKSEIVAKAGEVKPTGHGFLLPNEIGEAPMNVVFAPPEKGSAKTVDEMVASTERGVWVTRLWYIREVDPYEKILTGMTRDGTFYVENGKVQYGIRNFRFNQSLVELLSKVEALSVPVRASGEESFDMVVPAMKVKDFNFTEATKF